MTKQELLEHVNNFPDDRRPFAVAIWQRDDVIEFAEERDIKISDAEADAVIERMDKKQDCEFGLTWASLEVYLDEIVEQRGEQ